ncbi:biosynthetic-type acetolactate synthase large subunit [Haloimpatiens sp. FM7330]|uniref:biosynthetic-type acetolactate synthase large subunit n=1 Tax=Haloimpatiens sp. FM7330 TaxID=3298610 RepID=UPI003630438B
MKYTGARIILECLKEQDVDRIFGYPGGAVLNIYDELYSFESIKHVLTAHEQGAAHAADGYARATGKVGVCIATSGPGATNLVTGIATAYMDSVPMVCITGQVPTSLIGKDSFQEVDICGITMPITKHNFKVKKIEELADIIRNAFRIAKTGRPGPVLVDIPKDITAQLYEFDSIVRKNNVENIIDNEQLKKALEILKNHKRPVMVVGGGCNISQARDELIKLQQKLKCPVCSTIMGLGAFDGTYKMFTGVVGMHGTPASNKCICNSDLIIAIGTRFSDRVISNSKTFASDRSVLHIDIDEAEVSKNISADSWVIGDVKQVLSEINKELEGKEENEWTEKALSYIKEDASKGVYVDPKSSVNPVYAIKKLYDITNGEAIITTEVGQNQIWATQGYKYTKPRTFITSGGLGTMGYGFGAAIGASLGTNKMVFDIAGDGSFLMNINELSTAVKNNIPVKILVLNNSVLGMVRQWQTLFYDKRYSSTTLGRKTDFAKIADAYGALGIKVNTNEEVEQALKKAIEYNGPVVIDCFVDPDAMATPIVPPGAHIGEMISLED